MRLSPLLISAAIGSFNSLPLANAYGVDGHGIVATIAQMHLHPSVLPIICDILDTPLSTCHLAPISTWADENKDKMPWSANMHFINPLDDHPSKTCLFPGIRGWDGKQSINVLDGVKNTTSLLENWVDREASDKVASEALKFLVHFMGDVHQPLHLTGRDRGGNDVKVQFGKKQPKLHAVWDGNLLEKFINQTPSNYSRPLPHPEIERVLKGKHYDPYIRRIMFEGVLGAWKNEVDTWLGCGPLPGHASSFGGSGLIGLWQTIYTATTRAIQSVTTTRDGVDINPDGPVVCPYFWAKPIHKLNCDIVWPKALNLQSAKYPRRSVAHCGEHANILENGPDDEHATAPLQLDTPEYSGAIGKGMVIEKLLAQGGVRLAGILNHVFAPEAHGKATLYL